MLYLEKKKKKINQLSTLDPFQTEVINASLQGRIQAADKMKWFRTWAARDTNTFQSQVMVREVLKFVKPEAAGTTVVRRKGSKFVVIKYMLRTETKRCCCTVHREYFELHCYSFHFSDGESLKLSMLLFSPTFSFCNERQWALATMSSKKVTVKVNQELKTKLPFLMKCHYEHVTCTKWLWAFIFFFYGQSGTVI